MSAQREVWIVCDVCAEPSDSVGSGIDTVVWAREHARDAEFHYSKGRDICPVCWAAGER